MARFGAVGGIGTDASVAALINDEGSAAWRAMVAALGTGLRPEWHGAVGDGTTDDTAAFVAAVAFAELLANSPQALVLTPGKKYRLTSSVAIDVERVRAIYGNNALVIADGNFTAFALTGTHTGAAGPNTTTQAERDNEHHVVIRDLHVRGPVLSSAQSGQGVAVSATGTQALTVTGCYFHEIGTGIRFHGFNRNVIISESSIYNVRYCLHFDGGDIHQLIISGNHLSYCDKAIYAFNASAYNANVVGNDMEADPNSFSGQGSNLIHIENTNSSAQDWLFSGNQIEDHFWLMGPAVKLVNTSLSAVFTFTGNYFGNHGNGSIHATNPIALHVTGNNFRACKGWAVYATGDINGLVVADNIVDGAQRVNTDASWISGLVKLDVGSGVRHSIKVAGNVIREFWGQVIDINNSGQIIALDVSDNDAYLYSTAAPAALTEGLIDVGGAGACQMVSVSRNRLYGRANTPKGVVVAQAGIKLGVFKENLAVGPTVGAAHTLPAASASIIAADNLGWVTAF